MNDICIPIPKLGNEQGAEVEVKVAGHTRQFNFRVESFPWEAMELPTGETAAASTSSILGLKKKIEGYDSKWELVQIYNPRPRSKFIQVLFRERVIN